MHLSSGATEVALAAPNTGLGARTRSALTVDREDRWFQAKARRAIEHDAVDMDECGLYGFVGFFLKPIHTQNHCRADRRVPLHGRVSR